MELNDHLYAQTDLPSGKSPLYLIYQPMNDLLMSGKYFMRRNTYIFDVYGSRTVCSLNIIYNCIITQLDMLGVILILCCLLAPLSCVSSVRLSVCLIIM
jgi:hypothetical protein